MAWCRAGRCGAEAERGPLSRVRLRPAHWRLAAGAGEGAGALVEADGIDAFGFDDARVASLPGLKAATGPIADAFFGRPSESLDVIASTPEEFTAYIRAETAKWARVVKISGAKAE